MTSRRGPLPKPADRSHRTHRVRAQEGKIVTLAPPARSTPKPPAGLSRGLRGEWRDFWESPQGQLAAQQAAVFLPAIRRLFYLRADYERTRAQLEITELMVQGSMGQWRTNPLADQLLKLEAAIGRLETEFGLTLSAAARLAVDVGGAKRSFEEANRRIEQQHPKPDPRLAGKRPPPRRRAPAESRG